MYLLLLLLQNFCQHFISLLEAGNCIHDLMIGSVASGFVQLHSQIRQFLGMGSIVTHHILHQSHQFVHGRMGMVVSLTVFVEVIVVMGMLMGVGVFVMVFVGVGMAVVASAIPSPPLRTSFPPRRPIRCC